MKDIETIDILDQLNVDLQGDVSSPSGFVAGGFHVGLRKQRKDFGWIYSENEAADRCLYIKSF